MPHDAHSYYLANELRRKFPNLSSTFYLDIWPLGPPVLMVADKDMIRQFTQDGYLPKHEGILNFLQPLTGGLDLVTMEGELWKNWRRTFNPAFSPTNTVKKIDLVMQEVKNFRNILVDHARRRDVFQLEQHTVDLAMDVIGHFVLGINMSNQSKRTDIRNALRGQLPLTSFGIDADPFKQFNPLNPFRRFWNARKMQAPGNKVGQLELDEAFRDFLSRQLRLMLFSGHDTTSSTLCYIYHCLWKHPDVLRRIREEHDAVFGLDIFAAERQILAQPALLEALPYTQAVIKETLRLYPVVVANRKGQPDFYLRDGQGRFYPTEDCLVIGIHYELQRSPDYWLRPDDFMPERWLVPGDHELAPLKDAWRPFEAGPRGCIGKELAIKEMKLVLVMTIREFDVKSGHAEWDRIHHVTGIKTVQGERAYQAYIGTAHPCDGYPCKVDFACWT
ncbi:Cytochrome P450-like protein 19 [Elsinoe fawcettii]|nr:Cytochrome P450-like protein 19 [Elsinoe fawcettii]